MNFPSLARKTWQTAASIKTGVVLLILVVILSAVGTIVLQRPVTEPEEMQRAYSPQALRILDAVGLTDVFHAWWFVLLMVLVSLCIIAASIERFPNAWRYFSRPYKYPDEGFRRALHPQQQVAIADEESGLVAAERALHSMGFKPERVVREDHFSIFAERSRISEMAVYVVHTSLLLIFFGGIVDGIYGWRGTLNLNEGETSNQVELRDSATKTLPFAIRCDTAGQENYQDGSPKKWWSKLAVVKDGQDVQKKEIVVNDPLVYSGIRFYQSSFGPNGKVEKLVLQATPSNAGEKREIAFTLNETATLDANTTVRFAEFIPDFVARDGQVYKRSNQMANPAAHLVVSTKAGKNYDVWLPAMEGIGDNATAPYQFEATDLKMGHFTGLQVSHEPGQWGVWAGVVLMGIGLAFVFYVVHMRFWAVPVRDAKTGKYSLWLGGSANRNRDAFEQRFNDLVASVETELKSIRKTAPSERVATVAGR
ncbi:MAG: cytochrome c biogenesis protein ResB [Acidobacteriales bacterium]|nr:cytochrome c biogenesis protein ResB [Candidatus Koribacter versatilis]MBI3645589.1 cytochrome c biogenesis protein ResB [Terriglobales bacterium]